MRQLEEKTFRENGMATSREKLCEQSMIQVNVELSKIIEQGQLEE